MGEISELLKKWSEDKTVLRFRHFETETEVTVDTIQDTPDTTRGPSLVLCTSCWTYHPEKQFKVPKEQRHTYNDRFRGKWHTHCERCRRGE